MIVLAVVIIGIVFYIGYTIGRAVESAKFDNDIQEVQAQLEDLTRHINEDTSKANECAYLNKKCAWHTMRLMLTASNNGVEFSPETIAEVKDICAQILEVDDIDKYCFTKDDMDRLFG